VSDWIKRDFDELSKGQPTNQIGTLPVCDEFAVTCTTALLYTFLAKEMSVPWRTTQELTGTCLLEAFGDGFTCFLHEKVGKEWEHNAFGSTCKG